MRLPLPCSRPKSYFTCFYPHIYEILPVYWTQQEKVSDLRRSSEPCIFRGVENLAFNKKLPFVCRNFKRVLMKK